MFAIIDIKSV